jgi:hypothetical protein
MREPRGAEPVGEAELEVRDFQARLGEELLQLVLRVTVGWVVLHDQASNVGPARRIGAEDDVVLDVAADVDGAPSPRSDVNHSR